MNVETSTTQMPRLDAVNGRRREQAEPGVESGQPFAAMLTQVHSGFGRQVSTMAQGLTHDAELLGAEEADARGERLAKMSDRADAKAAAGRGSRLAAGDATGGSAMGPRGHRLALQAEQQAQDASSKAGRTSMEADGQDRAEVAERVRVNSQGKAILRGPLDGGGARATSRSDVVEWKEPSDANGSTSEASKPSVARANPAGPSGSELEPSRADLLVAPAERGVIASVSKTSDAPSMGRGLTVEGPRAVAGAEQSGQGRSSGDMSDQAAGSRFRARMAGSRGVTEQDTASQRPRLSRSEFDRLVRTIRMQVGSKESTVRLHLRPPELGRIRIDARMTGNRLEIVVQAQTAEARDLLQSRMADLQAALERHGVRMERFELVGPTEEREGQSSDERMGEGRSDSQQSGLAEDSRSGQGRVQFDGAMKRDPSSDRTEEVVQEVIDSAVAETRLDIRA